MDTDHHVLDQGSKSVDTARALVGALPHANADEFALLTLRILVQKRNFARTMGEILGKLALAAFNSNFACFSGNLDVIRNINPLLSL